MKAIIFGGSGFLGSHVADALTERNYEVTIYDISPSNFLRKDQAMMVGDILDQEKVQKVVEGADVVYNFAGIADIEEASRKPIESVRYNILGNTIVLEASRIAGIKRFVFASSLYVYSKAGSFYRSSKQACELIIENYQEQYGLPYTILRYGSLYGLRADGGNFIKKTITQALTENKIVRYGDGEEIREYIHVLDAARGSVEVLSGEFANQHVILTGNQQMKVKDLLVMIKEMLDRPIEIEFVETDNELHYEITPYSFAPKVGKRLTGKTYLDLGQGILEIIYETYKNLNPLPTYDGLVVKDT